MGRRENGKCIDRVNMYASCWLLIKVGDSTPTPSLIGSPTIRMKSALKRRRTGSGGSEASSSGSEKALDSPVSFRGRRYLATEDGEETETEHRYRRGIMEDIMLPSAAMENDDDERF